MKMGPAVLIFGSVAVIWAAFFGVVMVPTQTISQAPSDIWRARRLAQEEKGRAVYIANGCVYCHSQYIRPQDWGGGAERIAQPGDYRRPKSPVARRRTAPAPTSRKKAASTRMIGIWPTSRIPATRGRSR